MFLRSVLTTRRVHVHVHTLRDGCVHTFLTYEVMSMRNFKHITPCLSHNFPQVHSKQSTTSRLFNLWTFLTMQLLTYKDVSVCKLSHMRTCLFATCHKVKSCICSKLHTDMGSCVKICTRTWPCKSKKWRRGTFFLQWTLYFESVKPMFSDIVSCVKSWIQRRVRKLKSCGCTSFRLQMLVVRWKRWCYMFNVTHRHVFVSQKVCRHSSCSVRTCAWTRLVDDTFVWKRGSRD